MFGSAIQGAGYGYGTQQFGPPGFSGNPLGQFAQPGQFGQAAQFGQPGQFGQAGQFGQPGGMQTGAQFGQQQLGGQMGGWAGGMPQQSLPFGAGQGISGYGSAIPQTALPLTMGPGMVPFQQTQPQWGSQQTQYGQPQQTQYGQPQQMPFGQAQFGQVPPHLHVIPVLTPQGVVGQLVLTGPQLGAVLGAQQLGGVGQQLGGAGGMAGGMGQFGQIPSVPPWLTAGYGAPQISPQSLMGGVQGAFGGGAMGGQMGGAGGIGGGYQPFQAQQQIPQQQVSPTQLPVIPIGVTNIPGFGLGIH